MKDTSDTRANAHIDPPHGDHVAQDSTWELAIQRPINPEAGKGLTTTIIRAVAEVEGILPTDVKHPPLYEVVDAAALSESIVDANEARQDRETIMSTAFIYRGHRIVVTGDGWVYLYEPAE